MDIVEGVALLVDEEEDRGVGDVAGKTWDQGQSRQTSCSGRGVVTDGEIQTIFNYQLHLIKL